MAQSSTPPADLAADNLRGIGWMLFSVVTASVMSITVRELSQYFDSRMIVMFRSAISSLVLLAPLALLPPLRRHLRFSRPALHILRGSLIGFSTHLGFYTLSQLPIATATVLFFTAPIFATVLAGPVHGEKVGPRRWGAVIAGFIGAVIILRPGFDGFHPAMLTALGSSLLFAIVLTLSRGIAKADGAFSAFFSSVVITALISLPLSYGNWALPQDLWVWALVLVLVLMSSARNIADIQAYRYGEAGLLAPITYLRLIFLGAAGYFFWGEVPDLPTLIGASIIIAATLYIAHREALLRRKKRAI